VSTQTSSPRLQQKARSSRAIMMGLGSIIGTGVFVSIGIAQELLSRDLAVAIAALVATCNGLNSAQLLQSCRQWRYLRVWL